MAELDAVAPETPKPYRAWVVSDGRIGRRNQCIGVAQQLPASIDVIKIKDIEEAGGTAAYLQHRFGQKPTAEDWPDIILSSGSDAAKYAIELKKLSGDRSYITAITNCVGTNHFDHLAANTHEDFKLAKSRSEFTGIPHKVTRESIDHAKTVWSERMQSFIESHRPIISALIGGDINEGFVLDEATAIHIGQAINQSVKALNGQLMITNSPRIKPAIWRILLKHATEGLDQAYVYDCRAIAGGNPYAAMLGYADVIVATSDSISMCCEAASSGKPCYIISTPNIQPDLYAKFHQDLYDKGYAIPFAGTLEPFTVPQAEFSPAKEVADNIRPLLNKHLEKLTQRGIG